MGLGITEPCTELWDQMLRKQVRGVRDWAIGCLEGASTGCQQGEGREKPALSEQMGSVKDWATDWFKESNTGHHKGEGRKKITLRVIELHSAHSPPTPVNRSPWELHLGSVKVEEYEVLGFGHSSNGP